MKKALALASICEFGGAVLMGAGGEHVQQQPALLPRPRCAVSGLLASPQLCIAASHHRWAAWQPATAHPVLHPWPVPPPDRAQPPPPPPCPVTDTIRGQIADVNAFVEKPDVLAYGCLCSVGERSVWCCSLEGGTCGRGCCRQRQRAVKGAPSRAQLERSN